MKKASKEQKKRIIELISQYTNFYSDVRINHKKDLDAKDCILLERVALPSKTKELNTGNIEIRKKVMDKYNIKKFEEFIKDSEKRGYIIRVEGKNLRSGKFGERLLGYKASILLKAI